MEMDNDTKFECASISAELDKLVRLLSGVDALHGRINNLAAKIHDNNGLYDACDLIAKLNGLRGQLAWHRE